MSGCSRRWKVHGQEMAEDWYCRGKGANKTGRCSKQKLMRHRMFTKEGELVATCVQEVQGKQT
jgi:acyl-CoA thioesterase